MRNLRNLLMNSVAFAAEGTGDVSGGDTAADTSANAGATVEAGAGSDTILSGVVDDAAKGDEGKGDAAAAEWKEYVPDEAKSAEENAAAKLEHDKTKPKADDDKKDEKAKEPADPQDVVPEDGKYVIKLEGDIQLDEALLEKASPVMKEIGLTQGQAAKLAGVLAESRKAEFDAGQARASEIVEEWQTAIKTDKDFGGDNLAASVNKANRVIATFGDDDLRRDLVDLSIGNHPGIFRLLARVGNALSDDKPVTSETPAASRKSPEESMYGATTPTTRG